MELGLKGKVAIVTGASRGIGESAAKLLAAHGAHVIVSSRKVDDCQKVVDAIVTAGGSAEAVAFDITDAAATAAALDAILAAGPVQILVNNAGRHADAVFPGMGAKQWHTVMDVNLNGFYNVTQPLTMPMLRTRWGRIVTITSVAGLVGNRGQVNYAAAKGALHAATKSLALELASRNVTVNAVAPGVLDRYLARTGYASQQTSQPRSPDQPANLWQPADGRSGHDFGAHGIFGARSCSASAQMWASQHHSLLAGMGAVATALGAAAARRWWR